MNRKSKTTDRAGLLAEMKALQEKHDALLEKVDRLEAEQRQAFDAIAVDDLEKVAKERASNDLELTAAKLAVQELRRRFDELGKTLAEVDYKWRSEKAAVLQVEIDQVAENVAETMAVLDEQLTELYRLEREVIDRYSITPTMWFTSEFRKSVAHRLEWYHREKSEVQA